MELAEFRSQYAGASCWMLGAGPSLLEADPERVQATAACRFGVNFAGRSKDGEGWHIKPTHWTTYDPTTRFSRCVFLDPTITKFVKHGREGDWLPESLWKVGDAPNVYGVTLRGKTYNNFLDPYDSQVNNSRDSFVMALDIAVKMGFRRLYCIGTELRVRLSPEQIEVLQGHGCPIKDDGTYEDKGKIVDRLDKIVSLCLEETDLGRSQLYSLLEKAGGAQQYSFTEAKPMTSAVQTDKHYWDTVQYLRQARKQFKLNGIEIVNCCPTGRLAPFFRTISVEEACAEIDAETGTATEESTVGRYTSKEEFQRPYTEDIKAYGKAGADPDAPLKQPKKGKRCCGQDRQPDAPPEPEPMEPLFRDSAGEVISFSQGPHPKQPIVERLLHNTPDLEDI